MTAGGQNSAITLIIKVFATQQATFVDYFPQAGLLPIGELRNLYNRCNGNQFRVNRMRTYGPAGSGPQSCRRPIGARAGAGSGGGVAPGPHVVAGCRKQILRTPVYTARVRACPGEL